MKAIEEIKEILNWYFINGSKASIDDLLINQDKLSIWACNLGEFTGELFDAFNANMFIRKFSIAKKSLDLQKANMTISRADKEALVDNESNYKKEIEAQGEANKADILLRQTNRVLDAMRTRISYLKAEKDNSKNSQT